MVIDETGGMHGIRDRSAIFALVDLAAQKAFGHELYKGVFVKAAVYARNIIKNHPFIDGNKRSAMVVVGTFLENNNYMLNAQEGEIEKFVLTIIGEKYDLPEIAIWLHRHSRKIKKGVK